VLAVRPVALAVGVAVAVWMALAVAVAVAVAGWLWQWRECAGCGSAVILSGDKLGIGAELTGRWMGNEPPVLAVRPVALAVGVWVALAVVVAVAVA
jgi:hypothetical protein